MSRKERFTLIGAALSLFVATLRGVSYLQEGKLRLGTTMVVLTTIGALVLLWRLRQKGRERG